MPTYEYLCENCGHKLEEFQSITAKPLKKCPACKKMKLKRLISAGAGIIFKGSGFYETDYRSDSYKKDAKADKDAQSSGGKKDSGNNKTDSTGKSNKTDSSKKDSGVSKSDASSKKSTSTSKNSS